jgi:putative proteasome-type protease
MTYCIGVKLKSGLLALSDTRITSGNETTTAEKYKIFTSGGHQFFLMTSGLRSVRDKTVTYFSEVLKEKNLQYQKLYEVVNDLGDQIKKVAGEDKKTLSESGLEFNINAIVGGKLSGDCDHKLFLLYPQGNWIEVGKGHPFTIIGNSGYGTPVLRRTLNYDSSIRFALKTVFLSFDSTRVSANDVGYPIDVMVFSPDNNQIKIKRYFEQDLQSISDFWGDRLTGAVKEVPEEWMDGFVDMENT